MKYGLNRINIRLFTQEMGWLGGKGVQFHLLTTKDQTLQMTFIRVNARILIKYFLPT